MRPSRESVQLAVGAMGAAVRWLTRKPFILNHLVTVRCNVACPFCYVSGPEQQAYNKERFPTRSEMTTAEVCAFYNQLVARGFRLAVLVGGEPLLRTDLDDMLKVLQGHLWVTVFTNGYLLPERHELIRRASNLFVSIDAPDSQHDELRGRAGTFERALAGIEEVRRSHPQVHVTLNTTLTAGNVRRVPEMLAFARAQRLPIAFQPPSYEGQFALGDRPRAESSLHLPAAQDVAEAFVQIRDAARRGERVIGSRAFFDHVIADRRTYPCHYPYFVLGPVQPNGDVVGCVDSKVIGNVRSSTVADIIGGRPFRSNAEGGPDCPVGCRDWGIFDLSALRERRFRAEDARRYGRGLVRDRAGKAVWWLATAPTLDRRSRQPAGARRKTEPTTERARG